MTARCGLPRCGLNCKTNRPARRPAPKEGKDAAGARGIPGVAIARICGSPRRPRHRTGARGSPRLGRPDGVVAGRRPGYPPLRRGRDHQPLPRDRRGPAGGASAPATTRRWQGPHAVSWTPPNPRSRRCSPRRITPCRPPEISASTHLPLTAPTPRSDRRRLWSAAGTTSRRCLERARTYWSRSGGWTRGTRADPSASPYCEVSASTVKRGSCGNKMISLAGLPPAAGPPAAGGHSRCHHADPRERV